MQQQRAATERRAATSASLMKESDTLQAAASRSDQQRGGTSLCPGAVLTLTLERVVDVLLLLRNQSLQAALRDEAAGQVLQQVNG